MTTDPAGGGVFVVMSTNDDDGDGKPDGTTRSAQPVAMTDLAAALELTGITRTGRRHKVAVTVDGEAR